MDFGEQTNTLLKTGQIMVFMAQYPEKYLHFFALHLSFVIIHRSMARGGGGVGVGGGSGKIKCNTA